MDETMRARAETRLDEALAATPVADPRDLLRDRVRHLRATDSAAFGRALAHFEDTLVPRIAGGAEPLAEWRAYGRLLAELGGPGRVVGVDATGRARSHLEPDALDLVLHLPAADASPASVLARPRDLSPAQRATLDLLVAGRREISR